eukprot:scaffold142135_cov31-Tisochrysis_lutea.AAC.3
MVRREKWSRKSPDWLTGHPQDRGGSQLQRQTRRPAASGYRHSRSPRSRRRLSGGSADDESAGVTPSESANTHDAATTCPWISTVARAIGARPHGVLSVSSAVRICARRSRTKRGSLGVKEWVRGSGSNSSHSVTTGCPRRRRLGSLHSRHSQPNAIRTAADSARPSALFTIRTS